MEYFTTLFEKSKNILSARLGDQLATTNFDNSSVDIYPFEYFMQVPNRLRIHKFYEDIQIGDVVIGCVNRTLSSRLEMYLTCTLGTFFRDIENLKIPATCSSSELPSLSSFSTTDSFRRGDLVKCIVISVKRNDVIELSMNQNNLANKLNTIDMGLIHSDQLPAYYKKFSRHSHRDHHSGHREPEMFYDSFKINALSSALDIKDKLKLYNFQPSHIANYSLLDVVNRIEIKPDETARSLRHSLLMKQSKQFVIRGVECFKNSKYSEALQCYNHALSINESNVDALVARGALRSITKSFKLAITDLKRAVQIEPTHKNAALYLAKTTDDYDRSLRRLDIKEKMIQHYRDYDDGDLNSQTIEGGFNRNNNNSPIDSIKLFSKQNDISNPNNFIIMSDDDDDPKRKLLLSPSKEQKRENRRVRTKSKAKKRRRKSTSSNDNDDKRKHKRNDKKSSRYKKERHVSLDLSSSESLINDSPFPSENCSSSSFIITANEKDSSIPTGGKPKHNSHKGRRTHGWRKQQHKKSVGSRSSFHSSSLSSSSSTSVDNSLSESLAAVKATGLMIKENNRHKNNAPEAVNTIYMETSSSSRKKFHSITTTDSFLNFGSGRNISSSSSGKGDNDGYSLKAALLGNWKSNCNYLHHNNSNYSHGKKSTLTGGSSAKNRNIFINEPVSHLYVAQAAESQVSSSSENLKLKAADEEIKKIEEFISQLKNNIKQ